jgi:hypothetical protein
MMPRIRSASGPGEVGERDAGFAGEARDLDRDVRQFERDGAAGGELGGGGVRVGAGMAEQEAGGVGAVAPVEQQRGGVDQFCGVELLGGARG